MKNRLKKNGIIIFLVCLLLVIFPRFFFKGIQTGYLDEIAEVFGVTLILLGQLLRVSARGYKAEMSKEGKSLVKTGPYSLVRNPMYLGIILIGIGIVLMLFNWWAAVIFLLGFTLRYIKLIFKEENKLLQLFPQEYASYQKNTPRLFPRIKIIFEKHVAEYLPLKLAWVNKEIGSILAVLLVTLLVESWKDIKTEGLLLYLKESVSLFISILLFICFAVYLSRRTQQQK